MQRGERELIRRIAAALRADPARVDAAPGVPFGDDLASIGRGGLLWSTDMLMDGVDFDSSRHDWRAIGRKALAVSLSDCAACAARPVSALVAVALCDALHMEDATALLDGVIECGRTYGCTIAGGDTNSWPHPTVISVAVAAEPIAGAAVLRCGARPGDALYVSGALGGSILGRHMTFEPRIALAGRLVRSAAPRAMIDISDGLAPDLHRICEASCCGAVLRAELLDAAVHDDARRLALQTHRPPREHALHDGEDFELLVALDPAEASAAAALGLLPLGEFVADAGVRLMERDGAMMPIEDGGWEHFR